MIRRIWTAALPLVLLVIFARAAEAQTAAPASGAIAGRVAAADGTPVTGVEIRIPGLRRRTTSGEGGSFSFEGLPPGDYLLEASDPRVGATVERVRVASGATAELTLTLDLAEHHEEIVVTATPEPRSRDEAAAAISVIDTERLQQRLQPTLGETLNHEPGVSSTAFGQGASRPVIRGLGGDRIRVLESGIGTGDASTTSPDHAVSVDPISAERIEIVRGPATLLFGSSAVGGVVNVIDGRIPDSLPGETLSGSFDARGSSNASERAGNLQLDGGAGPLAWHLEGFRRETDDYESGEGTVVNSALDSDGGSAGISWVGSKGYLGVAGTRFDTTYGNPAEEEVTIDLQQRRFDLQGEITQPFAAFRGMKVRFGRTDYEHVELEGSEIGTRFLNDAWEGRVEALQRTFGPLSGSFGVQAGRRDFSALGEEAFVPPTTTDSRAVFTFQEITRGSLRYQLGLRYEAQTVDADVEEGIASRDLSGVSGSLGFVWLPGDDYGISLALSRSVKLPNAEELFSNGPHIATAAFEIGDPGLREETSLGAEVSFRKRSGRLTGSINLFANRFDDFIYEQLTGDFVGDEEEGEEPLRVVRFVQQDAELRGAELTGILQLVHAEPHHVDAEFGADFVRAELHETGEPLPRIPPRRYRLGFHYHGDRFQGLIEGVRAESQDRISAFETPTDGYTLLNANVGYRLFAGNLVYDLLLRGTNLTDELAFNHVSFLKDVAPLPGRDLSLALKVSF